MSDNERMYASLLEASPVGIFQADRNGDVIFANDALRRLTGLQGTPSSSAILLARVHPDDRDWVTEYWQRILREGVAGLAAYRILGPAGQLCWLQAEAVPILDRDGHLTSFAVTVTDITAERELRGQAERLSRFYDTLRQVNAAIMYCSSEQQLYEAVCRIMVEKGGIASVTVHRANLAGRKAILATTAGAIEDIVRRHASEVDLDNPGSQLAVAEALLTGAAATDNDVQNGERYSPRVRQSFREYHVGAMCAVPFTRFGETVAALSFGPREKDFFSAGILALLDEVGRNVSFALENLAREQQRRQAEEMLVRSEENLRVTLRSIGDAVIAADTEGKVTLMNPVAEDLTGWSEAEASGRPVAEVFHIINEETRTVVASPIDIVLRDGATVALANHTVLIARDGTERPIADSGAPIRIAEGGDVRGVVLVFRDQSEEHRMLKRLRDSERRYATLVEMLPVGVFESNIYGITTYSNPALRMLNGIDKDQVNFDEWLAVVHPEDRDRLTAAWNQAIPDRRKFNIEFRFRYPDGRITWVQVTLIPRLGDDNTLQGYLGAAINVTGERERQHRVEQLSKLYATLSQVNSAIVHCRDEQELYDRVVSILVERGGFACAIVSRADWSRRKLVYAAGCSTSSQDEVIREIREFDLDDVEFRNTATMALLSGVPTTTNDFENDERFSLRYRKAVRSIGVHAGTSTVLSRCGEPVASLTLLSAEQNFFSLEILALIDEVGRDVSFALENFSREQQRRDAEEALARNEERLRLALSVTSTGLYEADYSTNRLFLSATGAQIMGLGTGALEMDIDNLIAKFPAAERESLFATHHEIISGTRDNFTHKRLWQLPDGTKRWLRLQGALTAERDAQGKPLRLLGVIANVTEEKELEERERMAATVFDNSGESIMIIDASSKIVMINHAFSRITGYAPEEVLGIAASQIRSERHDDAFYKEILKVAQRDGTWQGELWRRRKNGEAYPALVTYSSVKDESGEITHYAVQATDISQQKEYEERINYLAYRDALTDLPNRALLRDRVEQSIAIAHREQHTLAMLFLDLDYFKNINDSLGHAVGDCMLKELAQRLIAAIREMDTVGRLGGDEFLLLLPDADAEAAAQVAQKLLKECARPFVIESRSLTVTPSIGIALYPKDGECFDELLKMADTAMYRAKEEGRNTYRFYTQEMNRAVFQHMVLENDLRRAIKQNELILHYQPKFDLRQRSLVGVEALVRWHHSEMGMIAPEQFIPVAEESDLIEAIGAWVLEEACRQAKAWMDEGLPPLRVAVNFSARQFAARNVAELVIASLNKTGVSGEFLEIEITESLLANDIDHTIEVLRKLKQHDVEVAVDDFGTGYSSLSYLKRFPIDRLKIDQSFIRDLVTDADDRAIATTIVTLGQSLGMRVIAEGVETLEQMELLRAMGCDEVQGYYMGRPISADEMTIALRKFMAIPSRAA